MQYVNLVLPQEPFADWIFKPPPPETVHDPISGEAQQIQYMSFDHITEFTLALSPQLVGKGVRRRFEEIENPLNWDQSVSIPYLSPLLPQVHDFFPNLRVFELDFAVENVFYSLISSTANSRFRGPGSFLPNIQSFTLRCSLMALSR